MKQYNAVKAKHPGALLLFRVGDFYETFGEDAIAASKILDITLTKRSNGAASQVALAGFPHHAIDNYLPKLVRAGKRVAICDQLEDPKSVKGIVKRGVTELVTPGVSYNDHVLDVKCNNYLASLFFNKNDVGIAFLDISTGEFYVAQGDTAYVDKLVQSFVPSEIIFSKTEKATFAAIFGERYNTYTLDDWVYTHDFGQEKLKEHFGTSSLKGFGVDTLPEGVTAAGAILQYLEDTEHRETGHITAISRLEEDHYVWLDKFTIRNLELLYAQQEGGVPLLEVLDHTQTPMGGRLLKRWVVLPLKEQAAIQERLDRVELLLQEKALRQELTAHLQPIGDLERLISKVAARRINPREMVQLRRALEHIAPIKELLEKTGKPALQQLSKQLDACDTIREKIAAELKDDPPVVANLGGLIREGIHEELDELRKISFSGKDFLNQIQQRESARTGISSLKIAYNKVFGYYLEVTNAHKDKVPPEWIRKQTLVNAERYITQELKEYEDKILNAEEKIVRIEQELFLELLLAVVQYIDPIQKNARLLAQIDCLLSLAAVAEQQKYGKPEVSDTKILNIKAGRHPVIEHQLPLGESYVPNDVYLDDEEQQIIIITGPNMAGKSALLRQTALIVLLAQMGSFVPAKSAHIGLVDKIFTRVGASDNLSRGESTFMVEMTETASILNNLSDRSLVLMDEIGRGTSTYDGLSIAWSIVEHLHNHPKSRAKTLFATHYHELNDLAQDFNRVKNFNVSVKEVGDKVIFLRKLKPGGSEHSFGIHVAQMAGMPNSVVLRAHELLSHLEKDKMRDKTKKRLEQAPKANFQMRIFEPNNPHYEKVLQLLDTMDINTLSPVEALLKLNEIKKQVDAAQELEQADE